MNTSYRETDRRLSDVAQQKRIAFTLILVGISANLQLTRKGIKRLVLIYFVYLSITVVVSRKEIQKPHEYIMEASHVYWTVIGGILCHYYLRGICWISFDPLSLALDLVFGR
ncbi:uncharacterized protein BDW70DRAFT_13975 [Aspergillus foveolatus]|uniref:uncharacterized protein n=1 Tax=Aspergillus foveolatus TaxID=210207 RepID=UPI003CCD03FA